MKKMLFFPLFLSMSLFGNAQKKSIDKSVVAGFDIDQYLGTWYEIARFDHPFERNLVGIQANYSLRKDGKIKVVNSGYKNDFDGKKSKAVGKAKIPDKNIPAKLKVSFFLFFYADYFVLELDKNYKWAVVGSSSDKYLWILARSPEIHPDLYSKILQLVHDRGYDTSKLIMVDHGFN